MLLRFCPLGLPQTMSSVNSSAVVADYEHKKEQAERLAEVKASLAKKETWGTMTPWKVWGGLHAATRRGELVQVHDALEAGADVNAKNMDGQTALHMASIHGQFDIAELLLKTKGCDAEVVDRHEKTAMQYAFEANNHDIVRVTLQNTDMRGEEVHHYLRLAIRNQMFALERVIRDNTGTAQCPLGCGHVIKKSEREHHMEDRCPQRPVPCALFCGKRITPVQQVLHEQEDCTEFRMQCLACGAELRRREYAPHNQYECPKRKVRNCFGEEVHWDQKQVKEEAHMRKQVAEWTPDEVVYWVQHEFDFDLSSMEDIQFHVRMHNINGSLLCSLTDHELRELFQKLQVRRRWRRRERKAGVSSVRRGLLAGMCRRIRDDMYIP